MCFGVKTSMNSVATRASFLLSKVDDSKRKEKKKQQTCLIFHVTNNKKNKA